MRGRRGYCGYILVNFFICLNFLFLLFKYGVYCYYNFFKNLFIRGFRLFLLGV